MVLVDFHIVALGLSGSPQRKVIGVLLNPVELLNHLSPPIFPSLLIRSLQDLFQPDTFIDGHVGSDFFERSQDGWAGVKRQLSLRQLDVELLVFCFVLSATQVCSFRFV